MIIILKYTFSMNDEFLNYDATIPALLCEGNFIDELIPINDPEIVSLRNDIAALTTRIEQLTIDNNTQSLRIEVERVKRRKLHSSFRQLKHILPLPCSEVTSLRQDTENDRSAQHSINYQFGGEIDRLNTLSFRCFSRIHQLMNSMVPYLVMPPNEYSEMMQMLYELNGTLHQFYVHHQVSYV